MFEALVRNSLPTVCTVSAVSLFMAMTLSKSTHADINAERPRLHLVSGTNDKGEATRLWTEGIAVAIGHNIAGKLARQKLPVSPAASEWDDILEHAIVPAEKRAKELVAIFNVTPIHATIVAGNRGSSDAFAWLPNNIGINVQAFAKTYGIPDDGAIDKMTRILMHEYVHLLTYAYYPDHRERRKTPIDRALWTMFFEGMGDYISLSSRWLRGEDGVEPEVARTTLARLEPKLVARLEKLLRADDETEAELRRGISMGRFDEKWGSLPVALWLRSEAALCGETATLRAFLGLERTGVLMLAHRHAAEHLQSRIRKLMQHTGRTPGESTCLSAYATQTSD